MDRVPARRSSAAVLCAVIVGSFAVAAPAAAASEGPFSAHAAITAVHLDAATFTAQKVRIVDLDAGVAQAVVASGGITQRVNDFGNTTVPSEALGKRSYAEASTASLGIARAPDASPQVDLTGLKTTAVAPGDEPASASLLRETAIGTVASAELVTRRAEPLYSGASCLVGVPLSAGSYKAEKVEILEMGADPQTPGFDREILSATGPKSPARDGVDARAVTQMFANGSGAFGIVSATFAELAPVTLFAGTPNETTFDVGGPAILRVLADGTNGGASVDFDTPPLVSVVRNGSRTVVVPDDPKGQVIELSDGTVLRVRVGVLNRSEAAKNGRSASASASILTIDVLESATPALDGATFAIGHMEAATEVPAGGITCSLQVEVDATPEQQRVGKTVDVTTTVTNPFDCPVRNVVLTDTLNIENDALFTITDAPGAIRKTGGTFLDRGVVVWELGTIPPRRSVSREFTIRVDDGAGRIRVSAIAEGLLADCKVAPGADDADVAGLGAADTGISGASPNVRIPISEVLGAPLRPPGSLPTTGVGSAAVAGMALLGSAGGLAAVLRRRLGS